jgi:hypothetical protein
MSLFGLGRNQKTFRPKKSAPSGTKGAELRKHIDATLGSGNLREAVKLPPGEDLNEWLAVNSELITTPSLFPHGFTLLIKLLFFFSCGFLQSGESVIWYTYRVLHPGELFYNDCWSQVQISLLHYISNFGAHD